MRFHKLRKQENWQYFAEEMKGKEEPLQPFSWGTQTRGEPGQQTFNTRGPKSDWRQQGPGD